MGNPSTGLKYGCRVSGSLRSNTIRPPRAIRGLQCCLCIPSGNTNRANRFAAGVIAKIISMSGISGGGWYGSTTMGTIGRERFRAKTAGSVSNRPSGPSAYPGGMPC